MKSLETKKLLTYVLGAYGISGFFSLPLILNSRLSSGIIYYSLMFFAQFGPLVSAFGTTLAFNGKKGIRELVKKGTYWRFSWHIYVLALLTPAIFMYGSIFFGATVFKLSPIVWFMVPNTLLTALVAPLGEEFGWRGVATPLLQRKLSPLKTSIVLGIIWAGWHYWLFLIPGLFKNDIPFVVFLLGCIADTLWFTWFYNKSKFSILPGLLFHFSYNLAYHVVPINPLYFYGNITPYFIMIVFEMAVGVILNLISVTKIKNVKC